MLGTAYKKVADSTCSASTIRCRRDEWITTGVFTALEQAALEANNKVVGLGLEDLCIDGYIVKAPCGGEPAGRAGAGAAVRAEDVLSDRGLRCPPSYWALPAVIWPELHSF